MLGGEKSPFEGFLRSVTKPPAPPRLFFFFGGGSGCFPRWGGVGGVPASGEGNPGGKNEGNPGETAALKCEETREGREEPSLCSPSGTMKIQFKAAPGLGEADGGGRGRLGRPRRGHGSQIPGFLPQKNEAHPASP